MPSVRIAISADFLDAFSKLPRKIQSKTQDFIEKFKQSPTSPGLNYEVIDGVRDEKLRSLRVDLSYRAIVLKPEQGNVYLVLWVDKHDDAYTWAKRKLCKVNPESGALQIIDIEVATQTEAAIAERNPEKLPGRFEAITDQELLRLGIPEEYLAAVRLAVTDQDVDSLVSRVPEEAADSLMGLAAGYSLEELLDLQDKRQKKQIDTKNIDTALENPDSKRRFHIVSDDADLAEMLAAPLEKWRIFLHPSQRRLVERDWNGPVRVLGGAGTGKTVVAMHRARWLAENRFNQPNDRILFTTFTRNLAVDIEANLHKLCTDEVMRRIQVTNIDAWVANFLKSEGVNSKIVYDDDVKEIWESAYTLAPSSPSLSLAFYKDEWRQVLQAKQVRTQKEYLAASRSGRGTRLSRSEKLAIWPVFEEYATQLKRKGWKESDDAMVDACSLLNNKSVGTLPYKAIIVDEAQDMGEAAFTLIRSMVPALQPNDLFIVGDPHQRIYGRKLVLSRCGIDIRGRSRKLRINYRTTDETRKWATQVLTGMNVDDLDGGKDDLKDYRSLIHGEAPKLLGFSTYEEEIKYIVEYLTTLEKTGENLSSICIAVRTNALVDKYIQALKEYGIKNRKIKLSIPDNLTDGGVRVATMHRVKGLQFDHVILAAMSAEYLPLKSALEHASDNAAKATLTDIERSLIHVAATRAKRNVLVSYFGDPSPLLPSP